MNNKKRTRRLKRAVALLLAVAMLPFADYGQALAYSGGDPAPVPDAEEAVVSGNIIDGQEPGGNDREGTGAGGRETEVTGEDGTRPEAAEADTTAAERAGAEDTTGSGCCGI